MKNFKNNTKYAEKKLSAYLVAEKISSEFLIIIFFLKIFPIMIAGK